MIRTSLPLACFVCVLACALAAHAATSRDVQLIIGGFDPSNRTNGPENAKNFENNAARLKEVGVTSHEVYIRWNLCEVEPGKWDWSVYDPFVEVYKKHGIKWVPFIICGSPYSLPNWYYKKPGQQGYVCLEHGEESDVQSLWNPAMREHVAAFLKAFADHYRDSGVIESMLLGVTGNYGEAIYPVTGNDWTADEHGKYHTHPGFWAGDKFAVDAFRATIKKKYGTDADLTKAWGEKAPKLDEVKPFLKKNAPNDRAWIDFVDFYQGSMTDYASFWLKETRKNFPKTDIYLCTGGHAPPPHGSDFAEQCRVAAEIGGGVRITNEASDYALNFTLTRWVASAGEQYGAYYSFEPAGGVDEKGVVTRIYNAAASGAKGLHYYFGNLFDSPAATENFKRERGNFKQQHTPIVEIAVFYPSTHIKLHGQDFIDHLKPLRDRFDFDYLSEGQIRDGGLKSCKAMLLMHGSVMERETWEKIVAWVQAGGLLIRAEGEGAMHDVEGQELKLPPADQLGKGAVLGIDAKGKDEKFRQFAADCLAKAPQLSGETRAMVSADGKEDKRYVTLLKDEGLLWLNTDKNTISVEAVVGK